MSTHLDHLVQTDVGVASGYRHRPKHVTPGEPLETPAALLKWYELHVSDTPVPAELAAEARAWLADRCAGPA